MVRLTIVQFLSGLFALCVTLSGAGYTIGFNMHSGVIEELRLQMAEINHRNEELKKELNLYRGSEQMVSVSTVSLLSEIDSAALNIISPQNGSIVPNYIDVSYTIERAIPAGYSAFLVVQDPVGQYWSWGSSPTGKHRNVQIGTLKDSGKRFEIGVIITNVKLEVGDVYQTLPEHLTYQAITVIRN